MISFINNHAEDRIMKNVDGGEGALVMEKYILCGDDKIEYNADTLLSTIVDDGWIFEQ